MANAKRRCGNCKKYFRPQQEFPGPVAWCSDLCGLAVAKKRVPAVRAKMQKEQKRMQKAAKERIKTRQEWLKDAQTVFNAFIRERDTVAGLPCVSCGRHHQGQNHAGHYRSVGSEPALRFCEEQVWLQCAPCNTHLSGNLINYRIELLKRIGQERLDWIEGPHEQKKYSIDDLKGIAKHYREKLKQLKRERAAA